VKAAAAVVVAARPVRVLHAAVHRLHDVAVHRAAGVVMVGVMVAVMAAVMAAVKAVVNFGAMANSGAMRRVLKATATTVRAQKADSTTEATTEATTARLAKVHPAASVVRAAMATNCRATSTL